MADKLYYGGKDLSEWGVWVSGQETENTPLRSQETVQIKGRNGYLIQDYGAFENITLRYRCYIREDAGRRLAALRDMFSALSGYQRLEDSFHPDEYRMARLSAGLEVTPSIQTRSARFTLEFDCKPQRFLKSAEERVNLAAEAGDSREGIEYTENNIYFRNPTGMTARPFFRVWFTDAEKTTGIQVGDHYFVIKPTGTGCIGIDCENRTCYYNGENMARYVTIRMDNNTTGDIAGDYPTFPAGETLVARGSNCKLIEVYPRWWRL